VDRWRLPTLTTLRDFNPADGDRPGTAVIINDTLARKYFPGTNPLGHRLTLGNFPPSEIVGVAANSKYTTLREPDLPTAYTYTFDDGPGRDDAVCQGGRRPAGACRRRS
jgi:MacB-like periplasmic core domain